MTEYISEERAWDFIEHQLKIGEAKELLREKRLEFLNRLCEAVQHEIPFQNIHHIATPEEERSCPSIEQNIEWVLTGFGGICWTLNSAMICVLRAVGLDVTPIAVTVHPNHRNHLSMILRDVVLKGDTYFIDFGMAEPSFHARCLDFEGETRVWHEGFRSYKLTREGDVYTHFVRSRMPRSGDPDSNPWKAQYHFDLEPEDLGVMRDKMHRLFYTNSSHAFTLGCRAVTFRDKKTIALKDSTLLIENDNHKLDATVLDGEEAICAAFSEYFPVIPLELVRRALSNGNKRVEKYGKTVHAVFRNNLHIMQPN